MSDSGKKNNLFNIIYGFALDYGIFILAFIVVALNFSLIFDNVVWGDEAFSANTIYDTDLYGIYQRIFFWDNHPPLYYYWLRLMADVLGYHTWVYHLASVIPFAVGIILSVTYIRKKLGSIPASFFSIISGLSFTCSEYNLEIRMYELCFFFVLASICFSYRVLENREKNKWSWAGLVLTGVLAAYCHYYGMVATGILLFVTSLFYFIMNKGKTWLYGVVSIIAYLVLYSPWLYVLYVHTTRVEGTWWMQAPETLSNVMTFMFGGFRMSRFLIPATFILSFVYVISLLGVFSVKNVSKGDFLISFKKPSIKKTGINADDRAFFTYWLTVILVLCFAYGISCLGKPMVANRYTYPLIPFVIMIWALSIKKLIGIFALAVTGDLPEKEKAEAGETIPTPMEKNLTRSVRGRLSLAVILVIWLILFVIGLMDFKLQRSIVKVQDATTRETLDLIGDPGEKTAFSSDQVQHLAWTVLYYYYPDNKIESGQLYELAEEYDEIWSFLGYEASEQTFSDMRDRGFEVEIYKDMWIGKYPFNLYHYYKP